MFMLKNKKQDTYPALLIINSFASSLCSGGIVFPLRLKGRLRRGAGRRATWRKVELGFSIVAAARSSNYSRDLVSEWPMVGPGALT